MTHKKHGFAWRALGLTCFIAVATAIFLALYNVAGGIDVGKHYRFTAVVPTALALIDHADVKEAGVDIGRVTKISNRGATAVLEIEVDPDRGPVHRDAHIAVRTKTLVGENYVDLDPGTAASPAIPDDGTLPIAAAKPSVQLDDVLSTISPPRRARVRRLLSGLGAGVADGRAVNDVVGGLAGMLTESSRIADALVVQREALAGMTRDLGTVFASLGERRAAIQQLVRSMRIAATAVASENSALRVGLRELPPALLSVRRATTHLAAVGDHASPVLDDLTSALVRLTPVTRDLPGAASATTRALRRLATSAPAARRLLLALRRAAGPTASLVPPLDDALRELRPALAELAPYSHDAGEFFGGTGQVGLTRDGIGHVGRIKPIVSNSTIATLGESERQALERLLGLGLAKIADLRGTNPYPRPDTQASPAPFSGRYRHVERESGS